MRPFMLGNQFVWGKTTSPNGIILQYQSDLDGFCIQPIEFEQLFVINQKRFHRIKTPSSTVARIKTSKMLPHPSRRENRPVDRPRLVLAVLTLLLELRLTPLLLILTPDLPPILALGFVIQTPLVVRRTFGFRALKRLLFFLGIEVFPYPNTKFFW